MSWALLRHVLMSVVITSTQYPIFWSRLITVKM
jgi:hypothetical protein